MGLKMTSLDVGDDCITDRRGSGMCCLGTRVYLYKRY